MKLSQRTLLEEFLVKSLNICITAPHGSGKTTLARKLCQESDSILFIDLQFHPSFDSLKGFLIEACKEKDSSVTEFNYSRKISSIFPRIIIDEAGVLATYQTKVHWGVLRGIGGIPHTAILYLCAKTPKPPEDDYCSPWTNTIWFEEYTMEEFRKAFPS